MAAAARVQRRRESCQHSASVAEAVSSRVILYAPHRPEAGGRRRLKSLWERELTGRAQANLLVAVGLPILLLLAGGSAAAEKAWVRGEIRLNLRTGPGTEFRIVGVAKTGDGVEVLKRGEGWTKIRLPSVDEAGWIPVGYLKPEPPPTLRLAETEQRAEELLTQLSELQEEAVKLREDNGVLSVQDGEQQAKIKQLTMENMELHAGARYPEWITGAAIFAAGMVLGAMLHRNSARRQPTRIRL